MDYIDNVKVQQQQAGLCGYNSGFVAHSTTSVVSSQIPTSAGISTAMQSLLNEVSEAAQLGQNLRTTLGISEPQSKEPAIGPDVPSLLKSMVEMIHRLRAANSDLAAVLQHLNS